MADSALRSMPSALGPPPSHRQPAPLFGQRRFVHANAGVFADADIVRMVVAEAAFGVVEAGLVAEHHALFENGFVAEQEIRFLIFIIHSRELFPTGAATSVSD